MRNKLMKLAIISLCAMIALTGCGATPKQVLKEGLTNSANLKSYTFQTEVSLNAEVPSSLMEADPEALSIANTLKDSKLTIEGAYDKEKGRMEANVVAELKGDLSITLTIPMMMNEEKLWIKVPNIPYLELPEQLVGKYLYLDMKELAEQSGTEMPDKEKTEAATKKYSKELATLILNGYDEDTYLKTIEKSKVKIPNKAEVDQIVRFSVSDKTLEPFLITTIEKILPEVLTITEKYLKETNPAELEAIDFTSIKEELASFKSEDLKKELAEIHKTGKLETFNLDFGLNSDKYITYQKANVQVKVKDTKSNSWGKIGLNLTQTYDQINKKVSFKMDLPKEEESISYEDFLMTFFLNGLTEEEMDFGTEGFTIE